MFDIGLCERKVLPCGCVVKNYIGGLRVIRGCSTHPGSTYYECGASNCSYQTTSKQQLKRHKDVHRL